MLRSKEIKAVLSKEANEVFEELNQIVGEEKKKGIKSSFHQSLLRSINRVIDLLKKNPFAGDQVPKKQLPKKYIKRYNIENLWRIALASRWRLTYTITGDKLEIINFILDIFNHKDYDKIFGYKH